MNRRRLLGAIPAAVAALAGVKASQDASPVVGQSEAIQAYAGQTGSEIEVPIYPDANGFYPFIAGEAHADVGHFPDGTRVEMAGYTHPANTYVSPRNADPWGEPFRSRLPRTWDEWLDANEVTVSIVELTESIEALTEVLEGE